MTDPMSITMIVRLCMTALLVALIINSLCAMFFMHHLDKYWSFNPKLESTNPYRKLHRFHFYGIQILLKKPTLKPVPMGLKLWASISISIEICVMLVVGALYIKEKV